MPRLRLAPRVPDAATLSLEYILDRITVTEDGCWQWQLSRNPRTGYAQIGFKPYTAHRLAFYLTHGRYPVGVARHLCHNKACCNPEHIAEGTHLDNWHDSADTHRAAAIRRRGRRAHNAIPTTVNGVTYPSQVAAMRALRVTWSTLAKLAT